MEPEGKRSSRRLDIITVTVNPLQAASSSSRLIWEMTMIRIHAHFSLFLTHWALFQRVALHGQRPAARNFTGTLIRARSHFLCRTGDPLFKDDWPQQLGMPKVVWHITRWIK